MRTRNASIACLILTAAAWPASGVPFTYQGVLQDNGAPAEGTYDLRFTAYADEAGGAGLGTDGIENVPVADGHFTVELDFGVAGLPNGASWLEVEVRPGDSGGLFTALAPRQHVTATPYAAVDLSEPWQPAGAGVISYGSGDEQVAINTTTPRIDYDTLTVHRDTNSWNGINISTSGPEGRPFLGYSVDGTDIRAYSWYDGGDEAWLLWVGGTRLRVDEQTGVAAFSDGVVSPTFEFDSPRTRHFSVPSTAFRAENGGNTANIGGGIQVAYLSSTPVGGIVAPVHLPDGAVITRMTAYAMDNTAPGSLSVRLTYKPHGVASSFTIAQVDTTGSVNSIRSWTDNTIGSPSVVDNGDNCYWIRAYSTGWPGTQNLSVSSVVIEYEVSEAG